MSAPPGVEHVFVSEAPEDGVPRNRGVHPSVEAACPLNEQVTSSQRAAFAELGIPAAIRANAVVDSSAEATLPRVDTEIRLVIGPWIPFQGLWFTQRPRYPKLAPPPVCAGAVGSLLEFTDDVDVDVALATAVSDFVLPPVALPPRLK